jgi:endonuclease YncB( thermonuclease family)
MNHRFILWLLISSTLACSGRTSTTTTHASDTSTGKVVRISDGDTFHVLHDDQSTEKIRLYGIDCPERRQPFSQKAENYLSELIFGRTVRIIRKDTDRYGRTVAIVYVNKTNVNEALLRAGFAWHYTHHDNNPRWAMLEQQAANAKRGLWADPHPTPPWEWRKRK